MGTIHYLSKDRAGAGIVISKHAYIRMKERNGWSKKTAARMLQRIYAKGLRPGQIKGYLKNWVNEKASYGKTDSEFVLFGEKLYIFCGNTLLTVLPVPSRAFLLKAV